MTAPYRNNARFDSGDEHTSQQPRSFRKGLAELGQSHTAQQPIVPYRNVLPPLLQTLYRRRRPSTSIMYLGHSREDLVFALVLNPAPRADALIAERSDIITMWPPPHAGDEGRGALI